MKESTNSSSDRISSNTFRLYSDMYSLDVSEHKTAKFGETLSYEMFEKNIEMYRNEIRNASLKISNFPEYVKNPHEEIKRALKDDTYDFTALMFVARYLHFGQGFQTNKYLALEISKTIAQSCEEFEQYHVFQYSYALMLSDHNGVFDSAAVDIIEKLILENYLPALTRYGTYCETGKHGVKQNIKIAEDYYLRASKAGHVKGLAFLARINRKTPNLFRKLYGWALTVKLLLIFPIE